MHPLAYPLRFKPILHKKIWGGNKLKQLLNKKTEADRVGESWEISNVKGNVSVVDNGTFKGISLEALIAEFPKELLGGKINKDFGTEFPLLIKFIDARTALSVQLHPGDDLAQKRHNSFGKTEMWYIMQAEEDAEIIVGFNKNITREEYSEKLDAGEITKVLNFEPVEKGDSFFIKPGKIHAIGAGVLLAEIQQTSDITYRVFDWNRTDEKGNPRELHTELALDALDYRENHDHRLSYERNLNTPNNITHCNYFTTNYLAIIGKMERNYTNIDSFVIYMCVSGTAVVDIHGNQETIRAGETLLIPAWNKEIRISAENSELLEIYIG